MKSFSHLWQYLAEFFLECEIFEVNVAEKIKILILYSVTFFPPENRAVYEIISKNVCSQRRLRKYGARALRAG
jgi:hypothetical protein